MSNFEPVNFTDHFGGEHEGWLLLGLKGAPAIVLCHGYDSNRSDMLPLGTLLRDNHFNVYLFNFQGPKGGSDFRTWAYGRLTIWERRWRLLPNIRL